MIPAQKVGPLIFENPEQGVFSVTDSGKLICRTSNPVEALRTLEEAFTAKIDKHIMPMIYKEGYNIIGEMKHDSNT